MRFFTSLFIVCATAISTNAIEIIQDLKLLPKTGFCPKALGLYSEEIKLIENEFKVLNYYPERIQKNELKLMEFSERVDSNCCQFLRGDMAASTVDFTIKRLIIVIESYKSLLLDLKSNKQWIDENPATRTAAEKLVNFIGSKAINLLNCVVYSNDPYEPLHTEVQDIEFDFYNVYLDVQITYDVPRKNEDMDSTDDQIVQLKI